MPILETDCLDLVEGGQREFTESEREEALILHSFLSEFVWTDDPTNLTDKELAEEINSASADYARCSGML